VTFLGVTDPNSWRRFGKPLLFDGEWRPKPAFEAVIAEAKKAAGTTPAQPTPPAKPTSPATQH
jgi:endo-1,4-beta-xylanase